MIPDHPLWIGDDAQIGRRILPLVGGLPVAQVEALLETGGKPDPVKDLIYRVAVEIEVLQARVEALEARTLAARWRRFVAWCWLLCARWTPPGLRGDE